MYLIKGSMLKNIRINSGTQKTKEDVLEALWEEYQLAIADQETKDCSFNFILTVDKRLD